MLRFGTRSREKDLVKTGKWCEMVMFINDTRGKTLFSIFHDQILYCLLVEGFRSGPSGTQLPSVSDTKPGRRGMKFSNLHLRKRCPKW